MSSLSQVDLQERLAALIAENEVPGASAAVLFGDDLVEAATGVLNVNTGVEAAPDSIFQVGSITKMYTATLVMQLVDDGTIQLDVPVTRYLPEVRFGDPSVRDVLTVRQFLSHTSGLEGDYYEDFGRGDEAIERYVAALSELPQLHAPGETLSYCNSGWVLLGRLVERLVGQPFHRALAARLTEPAGLHDTVLLPEEAILRRVAVGHLPKPEGNGQMVAPVWTLGHASAPAGSLTCATAADVVRFARLHLNDGQAADGTQVLSPASMRAMQQPEAEIPDRYTFGNAWGLGWVLMDWDGERVIGHDGGTVGQSAFLRVCPQANLAVALLTNGGQPSQVFRALYDEIFQELAGVSVSPQPRPLDDPDGVDLACYEGRFVRHNVIADFTVKDGTLVLDMTLDGPLANVMPPTEPTELAPCGDGVFLGALQGTGLPVVFYDVDDNARPQWVHFGARAHRRVS